MAWSFAAKWIVIGIVGSIHGCPHKCAPKPRHPGPLVVGNNIHRQLVRVGQSTLFTCCADGFTTLSWYHRHWQDRNETFTPFSPVKDIVQICNDGQVLLIEDVKEHFAGDFRCLITNGTDHVSINYMLILDDCDKLLHDPRVTIAPKSVHAEVGDSVKLSCEAYFGCGDITSLKTVLWYSKNSKGQIKIFTDGNHSNYFYETYNRTNWDYVGANLTIHSVKKENFSQTFICNINSLSFNVSILPPDFIVAAGFEEQIIIIASSSACVVLLVVVFVVFCWFYFIRISFWCNTKCNRFPRKGEFMYDTAIVCIEKDIPVVRERLLPMLRETFGYSVYFSHEDMYAGHGETTAEAGMFPNTYCAIMFVSKESLEENAFKFVCQSATCLVGGPYLILIKNGDIPKSTWKSLPRDLECRLKIIKTLVLPDIEKCDRKSIQQFWNVIKSKLSRPETKRIKNQNRGSKSEHQSLI